jgi:predicted MFS family arabinose efflux permease
VDSPSTGPGSTSGTPTARLRMEPLERRSLGALAAIYAARMLGLFLLLPVLALYAGGLPGATPLLVGLAMGAYGLTQACLQIPFGALSDRVGRRPVILAGLVLYVAGSSIGGLATGIWGVITAGLVQGAGAISGPVTALLADQTRTEVRTRAMALIGISIGGSFVVSLVAAPLLEPLIGVPGIFWIMAGLAGLCIVLLYAVVPPPPPLPVRSTARPRLRDALTAELAPYYLGIFALNFVLRATFFGVPHALRDVLHIDVHDHWQTYLGVFAASIPPTIPLVLLAERSARPGEVMRFGIALLMISLGGLAFAYSSHLGLCAALVAFFAAFNYLEARLPARLSQAAAPGMRGAALGIFATAQFLGAFAGGVAAGGLYGSRMGLAGVFGGASLVALAWLLLTRPGRD